VATLRRCWPSILPPPLLSSFKPDSLVAALEAAPEFARAILLRELDDDWRVRTDAVGAVGVNTDGKKLTPGRAREVKQGGFALTAYTINDAAQARALVAMGVDCVITDMPDVIIAALN
jgi:glycerophosphoryl diester phosphodiesterase